MSSAPHGPFSRAIGVSHHAREPGRPGVCGCHRPCCLANHSGVSTAYLPPSSPDCARHGVGVSPAPHGPFSRAIGVSHHAREPGRPGVCGCHRPCYPSHLSRVSTAYLPPSITDCALHGGGVSSAPHGPFSRAVGVSHHARELGRPGVCGCHRLPASSQQSSPAYLPLSSTDSLRHGGDVRPASLVLLAGP